MRLFSFTRVFFVASLLLLAAVAVPTQVKADPVFAFGEPVKGLTTAADRSTNALENPGTDPGDTSENDAFYDASTGKIGFYIPIDEDNFGEFGKNVGEGGLGIGTFSDSGFGQPLNTTDSSLTMYLKFTPLATLPVDVAMLTFTFKDLDLAGWNDPDKFFESVRFFDSEGNPMTGWINDNNDEDEGVPFSFEMDGSSYTQTIMFADVVSLVNSTATDVPPSFYVELNFNAKYMASWYEKKKHIEPHNTIEKLTAVLKTETFDDPEPGPAVPTPAAAFMAAPFFLTGLVRRPKRRRNG